MAAPPYMTVWVADWTADTQHLSCEQDGAYWRLIRALWRAHGVLPNDERKLAHVVGLSVKRWRAIAPDVLAFFEVDDASIQHEKLTKTLVSVAQTSGERSLAGERGGRAKALKMREARLAKANDLPPVLPQQNSGISDVRYKDSAPPARESSGDDWPDGKSMDHARMICALVDTVHLDLARSPGLIQSLGKLHAWRRDGASWEHDVLPVVTAKMQGRRSPITTWGYFDQPIAESIAANRAALTIPEHDDVHRPRHDRPVNGHDTRKAGAMAFLAELRANDQRDDPGGGDHEG